ncbi:unnamed protein product [Urochloa humidicola]
MEPVNHLCSLWYVSLVQLFLWQHRLNPHDGMEETLWSFDKQSEHTSEKLLNLQYQSFAVFHFHQYASEIPRMFGSVGKPLFILHFYTIVIKDP